MPRTRFLFASTLLGLVASFSLVRPADACSGAKCNGGFFLPAGGTVPASLPALVFEPHLDEAGTAGSTPVKLFRLDAGVEILVDIQRVDQGGRVYLFPLSPLLPDSDYLIRGDDLCLTGTTETTIHTGAALPLPASLGSVTAGASTIDPLQVSTISGSCSATITAAQAKIDLTLSADAAPFAGALQVSTFVDGKPFTWSPSLLTEPALGGSMHSIVFASCKSDDASAEKGLSEGSHQVFMRGTLPGTMLKLDTAPVEVTLSCGDAGGGGTGGGTTTSGTGGSASSSSSGGGCSIVGDASPGAWALSGLAAALAFARRRRSASR